MKILLATDGSPCSEAAIEEVARRPWPADSELRVVSVVDSPVSTFAPEPWIGSSDYYVEMEKVGRDHARAVLDDAAKKLKTGAESKNLQISTEILSGSPKRVIVEESAKWGADLIVVGSHGYRSWERMLLGSVSQAVAVHAECSVEIVRHRR